VNGKNKNNIRCQNWLAQSKKKLFYLYRRSKTDFFFKSCQKIAESCQKVGLKVAKSCQKVSKKVVEKLSKSCQKMSKKLSKSFQKVVKKLSKILSHLEKTQWCNSRKSALVQ
jgi:MinD-like ATPase involved in chromosome partitioning or flagellar assembly